MPTQQRQAAKSYAGRNPGVHSHAQKKPTPSHHLVLQRVMADPSSVTPQDVSTLQRSIGNRATVHLLQPILQAQLKLGPAGDQYEREADQVADKVVGNLNSGSMAGSQAGVQRAEEDALQMKPVGSISSLQRNVDEEEMIQGKRIQRDLEDEEMIQGKRIQRDLEDEEMIQGKEMHGAEGGEVEQSVQQSIQAARGGGHPLDERVRGSMEQGFGADFSGVRIHTGPQADSLNRSLNAKAFTTGNDIFFGQGQYQPGSNSGQKLLAHELTHTVQQGAASQTVARKVTFSRGAASQSPVTIQRLVSAKKFKKKTSLTGRKGKSGNFFTAITQDLAAYHGPLQVAPIGARIAHLDNMLLQIKNWLDTRDQAKTSRRSKVISLKQDLETEVHNLEQQLHSVTANDFDDANLSQGQSGETQSGMMNTVKLLKYDFGVRHTDTEDLKADGGTFEGFFKADVDVDVMNSQHRGGEGRAGIPANNPEFGKRNIAMYKIDQLLGANVVPPTFAAVHGGQAGIVMEKIQGVTGAQARQDDDIDMDHPLIRQGLSKIYLLDVICAQVDRHAGNYMVILENGVIKGAKAIDNDLAFGKDYDYDQNEMMSRFNKAFGPVLGKMPSELNEIDHTFAQKIIQLNQTPQLVRDALAGLVTNEEIEATLVRLGKLADFLGPLMNQQDGPVVTDWR